MRITDLSLQFLDGSKTVEGYSTPGWYLLATDADADDQLWVIRPTKLSPAAAEEIAMVAAQTAHLPAVIDGVHSQNVRARRSAADALRFAAETADRAALRARELAEWEAVTGPADDEPPATDPSTPSSSQT